MKSLFTAIFQKRRDSKVKELYLIAILFVLSAACGGHNTQVISPLTPPPPTSPAKKPEPAKQQPPAAPSTPAGTEKPVPAKGSKSPAPEAIVPSAENNSVEPLIRIGLTTSAKEIRISSAGDFYFIEKTPEASRQLVQGEVRLRIEQEVDATSSVYQIQVGSFGKLDKAQELKNKMAELFDEPVAIHQNAALGVHQVRVGEFSEKEDAQEFQKTLAGKGYRDAFIVKEAVSAGGGKPKLALRGSKDLFRVHAAGFLFMPSSKTSFLCVDGKAYRGSFDIILNNSGRITVVNVVGMEDYLLGVVPAEISPTTYPEFAALAALSVASRTYALYHMGRYRSEGYDLSDDTRSQVYEGVSIEKPATDEAVRKTAGLAIYYQDKVIDAMYMSTCGGRTEDFSNVFDSPPVPYLKSVFCAIETGDEKGGMAIEGKHKLEEAFLADDGNLANRNLELARVLGLLESNSETSLEFFSDKIGKDEAVHWVNAAKKIAQKTSLPDLPAVRDIGSKAGFLRYAAESFFGAGEIKQKISARDVEYYIGNLKDGEKVPEPCRYALTYLLQNRLWRPFDDNTVRPDAPIRRGDALSLLLRWVEFARPDILRKGAFMAAGMPKAHSKDDPTMSVKWGSRTQDFPLSPEACLYRLDQGRTTPVISLRIIGNEKIAFHVNSSGTIDFLEIELSPTGASSDRYSPEAQWKTVIARSAVAEKLRGLTGNIGELKDLKPYRMGNSGRVVQMQAVGSRSSIVLNGYKVRNALGLKDTLFVLTREHSPDGAVAHFIFNGRGWGHGVGLCQVGAFGMARAGHSYEEILKTYYQGVAIRKAY